MPAFVRWETPFTDIQLPSAVLYSEDRTDGRFLTNAIVAPHGIDKYPKYIVRFGEAIAFTCMEEMHFPRRDFAEASCEEEGLSAYQYLDSTWLRSYNQGEFFLFNLDGGSKETLKHYLIVGGDNNIEVITANEPTIETINSSGELTIRISV